MFHENLFPFKTDLATNPPDLDLFLQRVLPLPLPSVPSSSDSSTPSTSYSVPTVPSPARVLSSTRVRRPPSYLQDYHCSSFTTQPSSSTHHPLSQVLSYHRLSSHT